MIATAQLPKPLAFRKNVQGKPDTANLEIIEKATNDLRPRGGLPYFITLDQSLLPIGKCNTAMGGKRIDLLGPDPPRSGGDLPCPKPSSVPKLTGLPEPGQNIWFKIRASTTQQVVCRRRCCRKTPYLTMSATSG